MANTYSQIHIQVVFAVESRQNLIDPTHNDELQKYITGIVTAQRQKLIAVNNMPDHVHILIGQRPNSSLSDLVGDIKSGSTNFINRSRWLRGRLAWQDGFGAFSYSHSHLGAVIRYIQNQQEHHSGRSFKRSTERCSTSSMSRMMSVMYSSRLNEQDMPVLRT